MTRHYATPPPRLEPDRTPGAGSNRRHDRGGRRRIGKKPRERGGSTDIDINERQRRRWDGRAAVVLVALAVGLSAATWLVPGEAGLDLGSGPTGVDPSSVYSPVSAGEDMPVGFVQIVPRDFIEPIYQPQFVAAAEARWPGDADVIGVSLNGDAKAYPISVLALREMVVDVLGDLPLVISWCPICGTATVHVRSVDDEPLIFGVQGGLYLNAMTWWDHDTGSIWSQPLGRAIAGPREGQTVELVPSELTTWEAWRETHPDTLSLSAAAHATRIDLADLLIVVELGGEIRGYPVDRVRRVGMANDVLGGNDIAVVIDPTNPQRWRVFSQHVGTTDVDLAIAGAVLLDRVSGSTFDPVSGRGLEGPLRHATLERLPALTSKGGFGPTRLPVFETLWPGATVWWP